MTTPQNTTLATLPKPLASVADVHEVNESVAQQPATASLVDDHLVLDAPVVALVRRLHAGTTLSDRVRRMRGRREGMRLRRLAKAKQTTNETITTTQPTTNDNETFRLT